MTIDDLNPKIKSFLENALVKRLVFGLGLVLLMTSSFGLGKLSVLDQKSLKKQDEVAIYLPNGTRYEKSGVGKAPNSPNLANLASFSPESSSDTLASDTRVFGSKNGKNYYFVGCTAGNRIKEENKVWFNDADEAELAGYTQSAQCK